MISALKCIIIKFNAKLAFKPEHNCKNDTTWYIQHLMRDDAEAHYHQ